MAYDLEEQESLAEIKAWWDKWGTLILSVVTVLCLAAAAYQGWRWYQMKQSADAGTLYAQMIQAENNKDSTRVIAIAQRLHEDYAATAYAGMGALLGARSAEVNGKPQEAEKMLNWIIESNDHPELDAIASVRLAGVLLDQEKYEQALAVLDKVKNAKGQEVIIDDRKGDIYFAMGKIDQARQSWTAALKSADAVNPQVGIIQVKLNSLPKDQK